MSGQNEHDTVVRRLCADIASTLSGTDAVVLPFVRCQLIEGFTTCLTTFDVAVFRSPPRWTVGTGGPVLGPDDAPRVGVNVVTAESVDGDTISTPNTLARTAVSEYVLFDPSGDVLRPSFQTFWKEHGELNRGWPGLKGVFFSRAGFRLGAREGRLVVSPCADAHTEEELFVLRYERDVLRASGLDARIAKLEARLAEPCSRTGARGEL